MPSSSQRSETGTFSTRWRLRMATLSGPGKCRRGLFIGNLRSGHANPNSGFFQIQLRQDIFTLETDKERHWTLVRTRDEAEMWEKRLAEIADFQCRATAQSKGPLLRERLQPAFSAVDRYIAKSGNLNDVFASEFRFF